MGFLGIPERAFTEFARDIALHIAAAAPQYVHEDEVPQAAKDAGWEFMGHGWVQGPMHKVEDQRTAIRDTVAAIRQFTGKAPRGWESPGLTETDETIDLLAEEGIEYVADWVFDDQPAYIRTRGGPVVSVPYTVETNDIPMMLIQHHKASEYYERAIDQFEQIYEDAADAARVMAIVPDSTGARSPPSQTGRVIGHSKDSDSEDL